MNSFENFFSAYIPLIFFLDILKTNFFEIGKNEISNISLSGCRIEDASKLSVHTTIRDQKISVLN